MNQSIWTSLLACAGLLMTTACTEVTSPSAASTAPQLFTLEPTPDRSTLQRTGNAYLKGLLANPAYEQITLIKLAPALVSSQTQALSVTLPDGKSAQFKLRRVNSVAARDEGWVGQVPSQWKASHPASPDEIESDPFYYLSLVRNGSDLGGSLMVDGQLYYFEQIAPGQHVLIKVDESRMPPSAEPVRSSDNRQVQEVAGSAHAPPSVIRLLLVSSRQRRAQDPNYRTSMEDAVQTANLFMANSKVEVTYEIAGYLDADYDEEGRTYQQQLADMKPGTTLGNAIAAERAALNADLAAMYSYSASVCGVANLNATKDSAFSMIACRGALAHELGHNLGAMHKWPEEAHWPVPEYAFGHRSESPVFHTVMVTSNGAIPYFSNPGLLYQGVPMGTPEHADVARRFDERRGIVEAFYPAVK